MTSLWQSAMRSYRLLKLLAQQQKDTTTDNQWSFLRALAADLQGQRCIRAASSVPENLMVAIMHVHCVVEGPVPPDMFIYFVSGDVLGGDAADRLERRAALALQRVAHRSGTCFCQ